MRMVIFERLWLVFKDDRPAGGASSSTPDTCLLNMFKYQMSFSF